MSNFELPTNDLIEFCKILIQTKSVNGENPEIGVAGVIAEYAKKFDIDYEIVGLEAERPCVLMHVGPQEKMPCLVLVSHTDTVPSGNEGDWSFPPYEGTISDGKIFGRGACDNKGGIVSSLAALLLLRQMKIQGHVLMVCVPDEESGATGRLGIKYLHEIGKLRGKGAIYTYPGMNRIKIGHRGVWRFKITTRGTSFHTGAAQWQFADKSHNAVTGMADILLQIENLHFDDNGDNYFERLKTVVTPTIIKGGVAPSVTPDYCDATVDVRLIPSTPKSQIEKEVEQIITKVTQRRPSLKVSISEDTYIPPTIIPEDEPILIALKQAITNVLSEEPMTIVSGPANEAYLLNGFGIPTCALGPHGTGAHSPNEFVIIDSIFKTAEIFASTAMILSRENDE